MAGMAGIRRWIEEEIFRRRPGGGAGAPEVVLAPAPPPRVVVLRHERDGQNVRTLDARVDAQGHLCIAGQDLGPMTAMVSDDGEYEWSRTYAAADVPRLFALLGGTPGEDVLSVLERDWSGRRSYELEALTRDCGIEFTFWSWRG